VSGLVTALAWFVAGYAPTSMGILHMSAPGLMGAIHPFFVSIPVSFGGFLVSAAAAALFSPQVSTAVEDE